MTSSESQTRALTENVLARESSGNGNPGLWRIRLLPPDPYDQQRLKFLCHVLTWMETYLNLRTKRGDLVPFRPNQIQQLLYQEVARDWFFRVPHKAAIPKARQEGVSTAYQLLMFALCELRGGYRVAVVAHDEQGSTEVFSRVRTCVRQLEHTDYGPPHLLSDQQGHYLWESESSMKTGTIGTGDALGKGGTPSACHFSEAANFSDKGKDAKKAVNALLNAEAENEWTITVWESTAKGKDPYFYPICEKARDPESNSTVKLIFLPVFLDPGYALSWEDYRRQLLLAGKRDPGPAFVPTEEEERLRERLATYEVQPHERLYRYRYDLSDDQLIWRRWAIENKCHGDLDEFKKYYPFFYEEAFTTSSTCMFDTKTITHYRAYGRPPKVRGEIEHNMFHPSEKGPIRLWATPTHATPYVIGADPGGEKKSNDPYHAYVVNMHTLDVVADVHGKFEWDVFADLLYDLGKFYNRALLVVENNRQAAIAKRLHRRDYPNLYYYFERDAALSITCKTPGWNTNKKTRNPMLKVLQRAARKRLARNPDPEVWKEMETFVWVPKPNAINPDMEGMFRAQGSNHDDRILSWAMALYQCEIAEEEELTLPPMPDEVSPAYLAYLQLKKEAEADAREAAGSFLHLGLRTSRNR